MSRLVVNYQRCGLFYHNVIGFARALRAAGLPVGPGSVIDALNALQLIEVGHRAAVNKVTANDYQATLLHQFGLDHNELIYHQGGRAQKLTNDRPARLVKDILA